MKRRTFLLATLTVIVSALPLAAAGAAGKPNIIFILADDYGIGEVGCYGADNYKTPNIDALAKSGVRYTHGYTAPLCGSSRALILTGRYAFRTGAVNQDQTGLFTPAAETMIPKILTPAGYVTSMIGKWGQLPLGPSEFGFDDYLKLGRRRHSVEALDLVLRAADFAGRLDDVGCPALHVHRQLERGHADIDQAVKDALDLVEAHQRQKGRADGQRGDQAECDQKLAADAVTPGPAVAGSP